MYHGTHEGASGFHGDESSVADFDGDDLGAGSDAVAVGVVRKMTGGDTGHLLNEHESMTYDHATHSDC